MSPNKSGMHEYSEPGESFTAEKSYSSRVPTLLITLFQEDLLSIIGNTGWRSLGGFTNE